MYNFTEVTEQPTYKASTLSTSFGGVVLDDVLSDNAGYFRTLSVSGRGIVSRIITSIESMHGNRELRSGLSDRFVNVKFEIKDETSQGLQTRFRRLNGYLLESESKLEFLDDDIFYIATVESYDEPEEDSNNLIGTLAFLCNDPFKYSQEKSITTGTHNIQGHTSTFWKSKTTFTSKQTGYELQFNTPGKTALKDINKIVINYNFIAGDILEIDYSKRRITVNGNDISNALVIIQSNYAELPNGIVKFEASHETDVFYHERYY